jgi:hypothetical protein
VMLRRDVILGGPGVARQLARAGKPNPSSRDGMTKTVHVHYGSSPRYRAVTGDRFLSPIELHLFEF